MEIDDIKKLSPSERIKRLKELEEKRKKEIDEARKMITESEHEIVLEEIKKDIPIPEMTAIDPSTLFGETDTEMWGAKHYTGKKGDEKDTGAISRKSIDELEDLIKDEKTRKDAEASARSSQYGSLIEQIKESNEKLASIYSEIKGDPSKMEYRKNEIYEIRDSMEKIQHYKNLDDAAKEEMDIAQRMMNGISSMYKR